MEFKWVTLHVKDMKISLAFYQVIVGLSISDHIMTPEMEIYFLGENETKLELICSNNNSQIILGTALSIGFGVENLDEKMAFVEQKGLKIHSGPFSPSPSTRFFYVLDPNGLLVQFIEQR